MGGLRVVVRILTFFRLGVLARILTPFEFGLFAVATMALGLVETLTETGVNVFFIQKEGKLKDYVSSAFVVSVIRGALIAGVLLLLANPLSVFFTSPQSVRLINYIAAIAFLRGFINPSIVKFQENLEFGREFALRVTTALVDVGVSIWVSLLTRSAIGLVFGMGAGVLVEVVFSLVFIHPKPKLALDKVQVTHIIKRGKWVTVAGIFQYLFTNLDNLVVGKLLGLGALGLYQNAYKIASVPITEISDVFGKVSFPHFAQVADDKAKLKEEFGKFTLLLTVTSLVFASLIFFFARPIVLVLLGDNWLSIVPALKVLSVFGLVRSFEGAYPPLFLAIKKQELVTRITLISFVGLAVLIVPAVGLWGLVGAGWAVVGGSFLALPYILYVFHKQS